MAELYRGVTLRVSQWMAIGLFDVVLLVAQAGCGNGAAPSGGEVQEPARGPQPAETITFEIKGKAFELELALDDDARAQGLSDRRSIAEDGGMIFIFPYARSTQFVMRRCYVPIDLIYVDDDGYIDSLHAMEVIEPIGGPRWESPTRGYPTVGRILYAIELKGGMIAELGLKRGEKLGLSPELLQLKAQ